MKFKEIESLDDKALVAKVRELRLDLIKENSQVATGTTPKSPGHLRTIKKTIARIKTLQTKRGIPNNG